METARVVSLLPSAHELAVERLVAEPGRLLVVASARPSEAPCPSCGVLSRRVHSRYERELADLPWHGLSIAIRVQVRRFFCDMPGCARRIFCERLTETTEAYSRRTLRLSSALELIGLALGGEAGARLARELGMVAAGSGDSLLRLMKSPPGTRVLDRFTNSLPSLRALGVDDWAWRRGHTYGTILVDLEQRLVADLLPDREPKTLAAWLARHPTIEFISRDRAGGYAEGAAKGAPQAIQVADRFHLLKNLTEAVQHSLEHHQRTIRSAVPAPEQRDPVPSKKGGPISERTADGGSPPRRSERAKAANRQRRLAKYHEVVALEEKGLSQTAISRTAGISRATVVRWLRSDGFPERRLSTHRPSVLDEHAEYLRRRWAEGCHNATRLCRELRESQGYRGSVSTLREWISVHVRDQEPRKSDATLPRTAHPSPRRSAWLFTKAADDLTEPEKLYVNAVCEACPELHVVQVLAAEFQRMLREKDVNALGPWLEAAKESDLRRLAVGLEHDRDAVLAAICFDWSNGQTEGQVNRLKLVKRTMYGRAGFELLRRRVLAA
jgi:transposase